jgi:hypothetical protein
MWIRMDRNDDDEVGRGEMRGRHGRRHYRR